MHKTLSYKDGGVSTAIGMRMALIYQIMKNDFPITKAEGYINGIFYLLGEGKKIRQYSEENYFSFRKGFLDYYNEFCNKFTSEKMDNYYDRLYDFLDSCFPSELNEEVIY